MPPLCAMTASWPRGRPRRQQRPLARLHGRAEGGAQRRRRVGEALGVGTHHGHVVAPGDGADLGLHAGALVADGLGEAAAQHDRRPHAGLAAALQLLGHVLGGDDDDGEVGRLRQVGDGGVGLEPHHLGAAAADGIELAGKRVALHDVEDAAAQALGIGGGADQRHRARPEQGAEIGHGSTSPRAMPQPPARRSPCKTACSRQLFAGNVIRALHHQHGALGGRDLSPRRLAGASGPSTGHSVSPTRTLPRPPSMASATMSTRPTSCAAGRFRLG